MSDGRRPESPVDDRERDLSDGLLQLLIVVLTFLTASVAYLGARADDQAATLRLEAQRLLSDADALEASTDRMVAEQLRLYDEYNVAEPDSFAEEYYEAQLEDSVFEAVERNRAEGDFDVYPFDDVFFDQVYAEADETFEESDEYFDEAASKGDVAVGYRATLLTLSVGLSFAAWGSLAHSRNKRRHRLIFLTLSLSVLAGGLVQGAVNML